MAPTKPCLHAVLLLAFATLGRSQMSTSQTSGAPTTTTTPTDTYSSTLIPHKSTVSLDTQPTYSDLAPSLTLTPHNATTSSSDPILAATGSSPSTTSNPSSGPTDNDRLVNYFFVFIALFIAVLIALAWMFYRRRKLKASRSRTSRQNALARDLNSAWPVDQAAWRDRRRWLNGGHWRRDTAAQDERVEGLDERGEAPPPYKPSANEGSTRGSEDEANVRRPEAVLAREHMGLKPPDYEERDLGPGDQNARSP